MNDNNYIYQKIEVDYKNIGLLLLSGGTTGIPKLIPRRHCDYLYVAKKTSIRSGMDRSSIYLAALPMAHNFPLCCPGILGTFAVGGKVVVCEVTSPDEILPLIEEEKVTITGFVPAIANICMDYLQYEDYDLSSLKILQIGGSVLEPWLAEKIEETFNVKLQQIFGIAEGLILTTSIDDDEKTVWQTQGKPISEHDEILIVDKARKLKDGNYQIAGRIKEIINRAGEKITPLELEEILLTYDCINSVQVLGVPDKLHGEAIAVFILKS